MKHRSFIIVVGLSALVLVACGDDSPGGNNNNNENSSTLCGNGTIDEGELCDDGAANSDSVPDACRNDCRTAWCGDGVADSNEACDDGDDGSNGSDDCPSTCEAPTCGDGHVWAGHEACDDGNTSDGDDCSADCQQDMTLCGNGLMDAPEECDGGNLNGLNCLDLTQTTGSLVCSTTCIFDTTGCGVPPVITNIDGTGAQVAVIPRTEDGAAYQALNNKYDAEHRLVGQDFTFVVTGENILVPLDATAIAYGQENQGEIEFNILPGGNSQMVQIQAKAPLTITAGGLFLLILSTVNGPAQAQVFVLQGTDGTNGVDGVCTNAITGDLTVTGSVTAAGATLGDLTVTGSFDLPECPSGYAQDTAVTDFVLCVSPTTGDEMVRVGDFWIDRYEASIWSDTGCSATQYGAGIDDYPSSFPDNGNFTAPLYSCSVIGVTPSRSMTWFQAQAACAASGKHMCTNAEWQAAAEGTNDPGAHAGLSTPGQCNTDDAGPRVAGQAGGTPGGSGSCISMWGAEDMVGNLWEWTSDWWTAGPTWQTAGLQSQCPSGCFSTGGWPSGYGSDVTWDVNGHAWDGTGWVDGIPAAAGRGGDWDDGSKAGVFALYLTHGPTNKSMNFGARCCRQR